MQPRARFGADASKAFGVVLAAWLPGVAEHVFTLASGALLHREFRCQGNVYEIECELNGHPAGAIVRLVGHLQSKGIFARWAMRKCKSCCCHLLCRRGLMDPKTILVQHNQQPS